MNQLKLLLILATPFLIMAGCSRTDAGTAERGADVAASFQTKVTFLAKGEIPEVKAFKSDEDEARLTETARRRIEAFKGGEDVDIYVRSTNSMGVSVDNWISDDPPHLHESDATEIIYSTVCGKDALVVVVTADVNTGVSAGTAYHNALFDPETGEWITTFHGGEIKDRETGESISDDQEAILAKLKAGITQHCPQILDPNNDKAVEQLLQ